MKIQALCMALALCLPALAGAEEAFFVGRWQPEPIFDCTTLTEAADVSRAQCEQLAAEVANVRLRIAADTIELRGSGIDETMHYSVDTQDANTATLRIDNRQIMYAAHEKGRLCLRRAGDDSAQCYERADD